jgi:carboxyl-terminal processing protease
MNVSRALNRLKLGAALGLVVVAASATAQTVDDNPRVKQEVLDKVASILNQNAFVPGIDFSKWDEFLLDQKAAIDGAKDDEEFRTAVNTALHKFGASHVVLMTPRTSQVRRTGANVGVGISTQVVPEGLVIVRVIKDGPAEKAGLVVGDTIVEFEGKPLSPAPNMAGDEGTEMSIKVKHADGKVDDYKLTRQRYSTLRSPELNWIDKDTAQLKIYSFEAGYEKSKIVDFMRDATKAKNLIVDLRFNGGGSVANLQHLLGLLIPDNKPVGTFINRMTVSDYIESTGGSGSDLIAIAEWSEKKLKPIHRDFTPVYSGRLAVLINKFSGSASEIAAAALHDVMGAPVIGTKSAGAVLASVIDPATNGFMLQYPIEDYVTIKGVRLEGTGVTPDIDAIDVNLRNPTAKDDALDKASAYFAQVKTRTAVFRA